MQEAQALGPLYHSGWNTSGVGPGTRGYMGSWRPGGYNYGEGTRRPSASSADEYYAMRDRYRGNPLDELERNGPGRFSGGGGGSIIDRVQAEVMGSAATDPAWSSTMSGGATTLPPSSFGFRESPYGTKIQGGKEVPMTAEDLLQAYADTKTPTHTFVPSGFSGPPSDGTPIGSVFSPYGSGSSVFGQKPIFGPPANLAGMTPAGPPAPDAGPDRDILTREIAGPPSYFRNSPFVGPINSQARASTPLQDIQDVSRNAASTVNSAINIAGGFINPMEWWRKLNTFRPAR